MHVKGNRHGVDASQQKYVKEIGKYAGQSKRVVSLKKVIKSRKLNYALEEAGTRSVCGTNDHFK